MATQDERNTADDAGEDLDEVSVFYSNATGIEIGAFDVSLSIAVQDADAESPGDRVEHAIVRMSPQHALVTTALLMKYLAAYEKMNGGPMPLNPEMIKLLDVEAELKAIRQLQGAVPVGKSEAVQAPRSERK